MALRPCVQRAANHDTDDPALLVARVGNDPGRPDGSSPSLPSSGK
jgi:hypothetical protein